MKLLFRSNIPILQMILLLNKNRYNDYSWQNESRFVCHYTNKLWTIWELNPLSPRCKLGALSSCSWPKESSMMILWIFNLKYAKHRNRTHTISVEVKCATITPASHDCEENRTLVSNWTDSHNAIIWHSLKFIDW